MTETNTCLEICGLREKKCLFGESSKSLYHCNYDVRMSFVKNQALQWTRERSSGKKKSEG